MKFKKLFILFLFISLLLISIKPVLFTFNLFLVKYYQYTSDYKNPNYNNYYIKALKNNPNAAKYLNSFRFIKSILFLNNEKLFDQIPDKSIEKLTDLNKYNLFFSYLVKSNKTKWNYLDKTTLEMLSDKTFNKIFQFIIKNKKIKLNKKYSPFLVEYLRSLNNYELADFIINHFHIPDKSLISFNHLIDPDTSTINLKKKLNDKFNFNIDQSKKKIIKKIDFYSPSFFYSRLQKDNIRHFTKLAPHSIGHNSYQKASFFVSKKRRRTLASLMVELELNTNRNEEGKYLVSFDYNTKSNNCIHKIQIGTTNRNLISIQSTGGKWIKLITLIDHHTFDDKKLRIIFLQNRTGIIIVDNLIIQKIDKKNQIKPLFEKVYFIDKTKSFKYKEDIR